MTGELDCETCGACCCNPQENREEGYVDYVEIGRRDRLYRRKTLLERFAVENAEGQLHLRIVGQDQRCAALTGTVGRDVSCEIYPYRPAPCRRVEPGDAECLLARRERGVDPDSTREKVADGRKRRCR